MKKRYSVFFICLFLAAVLSGCGKSRSENKEISITIPSTPDTVDPQLVAETNSVFVADCFTSTLYEYNENRELVPCLAQSCDISDDGLTYTFHLKKGLKWSDGRPLTAEDFVFALQRLADPDTGSNSVYFITDCCSIKNAKEVSLGTKPVNELGVSSPDDDTFVVELTQPCPYFCALVSAVTFSPCNEDFYHSTGKNYANSAENLLSSGPYIIDRYEPLAMQIHFKKNPYYMDADKITIPGINLQVVANQQQALMCYESDTVDIISISGELVELAEGDPELFVFPQASLFFFELNQINCPALMNRNIRMALNKSLDREDLVNNLLKSGYTSMTRAIPSDFYIQGDGTDFAEGRERYDEYMAYDTVKAQKLWEQGLSELGVSRVSLTMIYNSSQSSFCEAVKAQMEKTLPGLDIELKPVQGKELIQRRMSGNYDMLFLGWVADYADPTAFLDQFISSAHDGEYNNPEYDKICERIQGVEFVGNTAARDDMMHKAEDMLMEDAALIPVFTKGNTFLIHDDIKGFQQPPTGIGLVLRSLSKEVK